MADVTPVEAEVAPPPPSVNNESFQRHFPSGRVENVAYDKLPLKILSRFEAFRKKAAEIQGQGPLTFKGVLSISHNNGDKSYVASLQERHLPKGQSSEQASMSFLDSYVIDANADGVPTGNAVFRRVTNTEDDSLKDKPYALLNLTDKDFREQGLGNRRLLLMNAVSRMLYGLPLHSDTSIANEAERRLWEKFVTQGKAKKYSQNGVDRYSFL